MNEREFDILLALISLFSGGGLVALVQALLNRGKSKAEAVRVNAETLAIDVQNRVAIEEFYSGLLGKREDLAEKIYNRLIILEQQLADQQRDALRLRLQNEEMIKQMHRAGLVPLIDPDVIEIPPKPTDHEPTNS